MRIAASLTSIDVEETSCYHSCLLHNHIMISAFPNDIHLLRRGRYRLACITNQSVRRSAQDNSDETCPAHQENVIETVILPHQTVILPRRNRDSRWKTVIEGAFRCDSNSDANHDHGFFARRPTLASFHYDTRPKTFSAQRPVLY